MFPNAHGVSSTTMQTPTPGEARFASKLTCTLVSYSLIPSASSQPAAGGARFWLRPDNRSDSP